MPHLNVFPHALAYSIVPSIFVGFLFTLLAVEWLGWTRSGLVVPGYLAPIVLLNPIAAAIIVFEAVLVYGIVRGLMSFSRRTGLWARWVGRDVFFAVLVVSLLIRVALEGMLFYRLSGVLASSLGLELDAINKFYGIGLVCTPLLANMLFKPGLRRGLLGVALLTGATALTLRFVLVPLTNFSMVRLDLIYEDVAVNFLSSPRSFIFILVGAGLASRMARLLGYEVGGILIPALLSLTVAEPFKLVATFVEAMLIYAIGRRVIHWRWFQGRTIEGLRLLLFAFGIALVLRFGVGHLLDQMHLNVPPLELLGFGYLISSHLALSMWRHDSASLVVRVVGQLVLATFVVGMAVSLGVPALRARIYGEPPPAAESVLAASRSLQNLPVAARAGVLGRREPPEPSDLLPDELTRLRRAARALLAGGGRLRGDVLTAASADLRVLGYGLELITRAPWASETVGGGAGPSSGTLVLVREQFPGRGGARHWATVLLDPGRDSDLVVGVPDPLGEDGAMEVGYALFELLRARALVLAGTPAESRARRLDLRHPVGRPYEVILSAAGARVLEVRVGERGGSEVVSGEMDLVRRLRRVLGDGVRLAAGATAGRAGLLRLDAAARDALLSEQARRLFGYRAGVALEASPLPELLRAWAAGELGGAAELPPLRPPPPEQLLYWRQEIIAPLLEARRREAEGAEVAGLLGRVAFRCGLMGAEMYDLRLPERDTRAVAIVDIDRPATGRAESVFLLTLSSSAPLLIEAPRAGRESGTLELAFRLHLGTRGAGFLAALTRPSALPVEARDLERRSLFSLVHQALAYELGAEGLTVQVRGAGPGLRSLDPGMVGVMEEPFSPRRQRSWPRNRTLQRALRAMGFRGRDVSAAPDTARLTSATPQRDFCRSHGFPFTGLYFLPVDRERFQDGFDLFCRRMGYEPPFPVRATRLRTDLRALGVEEVLEAWPGDFGAIAELAREWLLSGSPEVLEALGGAVAEAGGRSWIVQDPVLLNSYLVAVVAQRVLVVNLNGRVDDAGPLPLSESLEAFLDRREGAVLLRAVVGSEG
jgi:hypothetical protein